ncbi:helix-turn-helix domain-containing protein [Arthrobacter sp. TS-15]|uniref:helix-turn-helix domain-containing protein n=1 Tax=Arthrobacter sp. TS-15 TaxID=2510797 RepID=UPI00135B54E9|nr:helix-turn-helix domain-containing protein [Arthrobacter sp. TS-15]
MASTIFLDLDTGAGGAGGAGGADEVTRDAEGLRSWLGKHGAQWVEDISPSGGRHLYVPLVEEIPFHEARDFVEALAVRFPYLDPSPHRSVASGCCRVPGSTHRSGGVQQLTHVIGEAFLAVSERNPRSIWTALWEDIADLRAIRRDAEVSGAESSPLDPEQTAGLSARILRIARDGIYDQSRYRTPSEARMAVVVGATRAGLTVADIQQKMLSGTWPALAGLYAKYTPQSRATTLTREWGRARQLIGKEPLKPGDQMRLKSVHRSDTSKVKSQGGAAEHRTFLKAWSEARAQMELRLQGLREGLGLRMMLRALEEASSKTGSRELSFGVRALVLATATHQSTAAAQLQTLAEMDGALIRKTAAARGREADTYQLILPEQQPAGSRPRHRVHAVRPVFRELGLPAAFVYESLEQAGEALRVPEIIGVTGIGRSTVHEALETLASWGLARWTLNGWVLGAASLKTCAELLGVIELVMQQQGLYTRQRRIWHAWLENRQAPGRIVLPDETYPYWLFEPPTEPCPPFDLDIP